MKSSLEVVQNMNCGHTRIMQCCEESLQVAYQSVQVHMLGSSCSLADHGRCGIKVIAAHRLKCKKIQPVSLARQCCQETYLD